MTEDRTADAVRYEDVVGLKSRISWGAIFAGSVVALAVYTILTLFFTALGLSLTDAGVRGGTIGWGALIAAAVCMIAALFCGGCVATQLTAGETRQEAVIHGLLVWAVVTFGTLWLVSVGVRAGYSAVLGAAYAIDQTAVQPGTSNWEDLARRAGATDQQIAQWKAQIQTAPSDARAAANDPANREAARNAATTAAWVAFAATLIGIGAAIWGAIVGSGPRFRFIPVAVRAERRDVVIQR